MHNYYEEIEKRMNECVLHVPFMFAIYVSEILKNSTP